MMSAKIDKIGIPCMFISQYNFNKFYSTPLATSV